MKNIFEHIELLYNKELYSNVVKLCLLAETICDQKSDKFSIHIKCQMYYYYANSLYQMNRYVKAAQVYEEIVQQLKYIAKNKHATKLDVSDVDVKYSLHLCHVKLKRYDKAMDVLKTVPMRLRNAKINMALGNLYREAGMERAAITSYKEVLRESPLSLEAAEYLLALGVNGIEVNSFMLDGVSDPLTTTWINQWMRAHAEMHTRDYRKAVDTFQLLDVPGLLKNNVHLNVVIGQCYHYAGNDVEARLHLERAQSADPDNETGLDILASLLAKNDSTDLDHLIPVTLDFSQYAPEHWIVMAYRMYIAKKYNKAMYYAQQASLMSPHNVEAIILKGSILLELKKFQDATVLLRQALQIASFRYEPHEFLVLAYVAMNRVREALTVASNACKQLGQTPRGLTLYASVLMRDSVTVPRAKALLERAIKMDHHNRGAFVPAICLLYDCYEQEMALESAVALLQKHAESSSSSRLHQMLGDALARLHQDDKAFEHYNIALNLDSKNRRAIEGLNSLGAGNSVPASNKIDNSYYIVAAAASTDGPAGNSIPLSDHDADADSDNEPPWHLEFDM